MINFKDIFRRALSHSHPAVQLWSWKNIEEISKVTANKIIISAKRNLRNRIFLNNIWAVITLTKPTSVLSNIQETQKLLPWNHGDTIYLNRDGCWWNLFKMWRLYEGFFIFISAEETNSGIKLVFNELQKDVVPCFNFFIQFNIFIL